MGKICKFVFLDRDGEVSNVYQDALAKFGPEKAEEIYIRHMITEGNAKLSRDYVQDLTSMEEIQKRKKDLISPSGDSADPTTNVYRLKNGTGSFLRVNDWLHMLKDNTDASIGAAIFGSGETFDVDVIASRLGINNYITSIKGGMNMTKREQEARIKENPEMVEKHIQEVKNMWEAKADWGTYIHEVMEDSIIKYNQIMERNPDADITTYQIVREVQSDYWKSRSKEWRNELQPMHFNYVFKEVLALKAKIEKESGKKFKMYPELSMYSKSMKPKSIKFPNGKILNASGLAGTADLVFVAEDGSGEVHIADFKTKDKKSAQNFSRTTKDNIGGPFSELLNNPEERAQAQMSVYAALLREHGYKPRSSHVIMVEGMFTPPMESEDMIGNRPFAFRHIDSAKTKTMSTLDESVENYFKLGEDNTVIEDRRNEGAMGAISKWATNPFIPEADNKGQVHFIKDNTDSYVASKMKTLRTDNSGSKYYMSLKDDKKVTDGMSEEDIVSQLSQEYAEYNKVQAALPQLIRNYFYSMNDPNAVVIPQLKNKQSAINSLLKGINPDTHELYRADHEFKELADIGPDVLVAVDKRTRALSFYSVNAATNNRVTFDEQEDGSGEKRSSIFGKYVTDRGLNQSDLGLGMLKQAKAHDYIKMKLAWAVMRMRDNSSQPIIVDKMKVGAILGKDRKEVTSTDMGVEMQKMKAMRKYAGDEFPADLATLLDNRDIASTTQYTGNVMRQLLSRIEDGNGVLNSYAGKTLQTAISDGMEQKSRGFLVDQEIIRNLAEYRKELYMTLQGKGMSDSAIRADSDFLLANNALLEFMDFDLNSKQVMQDRVGEGWIRSASTSSDYYMQRMQVLYNEAVSRVKNDFQDFHREHDKALKALFKLKKTGGMTSITTDQAFENMYRNPQNKHDTEADQANMMRLKDENDPSLQPEEAEYIRVFKKWSKSSILKCASEPAGIKSGDNWEDSYVPIMRKKPSLAKLENFKSTKQLAKTAKDLYEQTAKSQEVSDDYDFNFKGRFADEATDSDVQFSDARRKALGLGDTDIDPNIETNLAAILATVVVAGTERENMGILTAVYSAVNTHLTDAALSDENLDTEDVIEMLKKWKEMIIFDRVKKEGVPGKVTDNINKLASKALFSYSTKQAMTELFTGMVQSTSTLMANQVRNFIMRDKEGSRFGIKDWVWAGKTWVKADPKMEQIVWDHGMLVADVGQLKSEEYKGASKFGIFKSKAAFAMNQHFFNASITQTFLAEMKKKGLVDAYVEKDINGDKMWVYDETLDKRFYIWDGETESKKPKNEEEWKQYKLWKAVRESLAKEGSITTDSTFSHDGMTIEGAMKMPLTSRERTEIKHYSTRLYGSFNKNAQVMGQYSAVGRAMLRYKNWFAQKYANYNTKTHTSEFYGKMEWVEDSEMEGGGFYRWEGKDFEGIIQSVWGLVNEVRRTGSVANTLKGMSDIQKENLSKMLADLILLAIATTLIFPFLDAEDNEFMKTDIGKSIRKAVNNGTADLNMIGTSAGMTESLFPGISTVSNAIANVFTGTASLSTGDPEAARKSYHGAAKTWGLYRSVSDIMDAVTEKE